MEALNNLYEAISVLVENPMYIITILFAVATGLFLVLNIKISKVLRSYRTMLKGVRGENLEEITREYVERAGVIEHDIEGLRAFIEDVHAASQRHLQGVGIVRFNAFEDIGGNQSFAIALLDGKGDGVVLSSLYGRAESRVYAKPVNGGLSKYALSNEERLAVDEALTIDQ